MRVQRGAFHTQYHIGWFLAAFVLGGALAQYPVGWIADKYDRRHVMIWLSVATIFICFISAVFNGIGPAGVMTLAFFFGLTAFPIYSVCAAHAHDFADSSERIELSAALMFFFALGAIAAPLVSSTLLELFGPPAMFGLIASGHGALILFSLLRMRARPAPSERTRYVWAPRTSFVIGRLMGRAREDDDDRRG